MTKVTTRAPVSRSQQHCTTVRYIWPTIICLYTSSLQVRYEISVISVVIRCCRLDVQYTVRSILVTQSYETRVALLTTNRSFLVVLSYL